MRPEGDPGLFEQLTAARRVLDDAHEEWSLACLKVRDRLAHQDRDLARSDPHFSGSTRPAMVDMMVAVDPQVQEARAAGLAAERRVIDLEGQVEAARFGLACRQAAALEKIAEHLDGIKSLGGLEGRV